MYSLIKVLIITSADQNRNMHMFHKKILIMNYIHLKLFYGGLVQTLPSKMSVIFDFGQGIICLKTLKR